MSDLIRRSQIYRALNRQAATIVHNGEAYIRKDAALELVRMSPSVEAEQVEEVVRAKWLKCWEDWRHQLEGNLCSACGFKYFGSFYKHCPGCGLPMIETNINVGHMDGGEIHESQSV